MNRIVIALVSVLASISVLHSGGTDGSGGHYNRSTGEYHYHHGYSAHSHYDMNGDGVDDCPYSFKDSTSNKSSASKSKSTNSSSKSSSNKKHGSSFKSFLESVLLVICSIFVSAAITIVPWALRSIFSVIRKYTNRK